VRREMRARGLERARAYSWQAVAERVNTVLRQAGAA
jgi:hypothetical protein